MFDGVEGEVIMLDVVMVSVIGRVFADWLRARNLNAKDIFVGVGCDL